MQKNDLSPSLLAAILASGAIFKEDRPYRAFEDTDNCSHIISSTLKSPASTTHGHPLD